MHRYGENTIGNLRIAHLALARIPIDLDDSVKFNYEKVQTVDGVKYPVLVKI